MLSEFEIRQLAQSVVDESKATAKVDQGSLKKSIAFTYKKGEVTFRELFYGQWNENSQLENNANKSMPYGLRWKIVYTELGGKEIEVSKTKTGRRSQREIKKVLLNKSSSLNVLKLLTTISKKRKKDAKK